MAIRTEPTGAPTGPAWKLIATGATLPHLWRIPLVVGTLLTLVNQGPRLFTGLQLSVWLAVACNYVTPYVVSSLGFLTAARPLESGVIAQQSPAASDGGA